MNHAQWKTRRTRQLLGEKVEPSEAYTNAGDAMALGQAVYDRRKELGLSQKDVAERAGMTQPQISNIEQAGAEPTLALLRRLAKALEARLSIDLDDEDSTFVFTPLIEDKSAQEATPVEAALHEMTEDIRSHVAGMMEQFTATYTRTAAVAMPRPGISLPKLKLSLPDPDTFVLLIAANASLRDHRGMVPPRLRYTQTALIRRMMADALAAGPVGKETTDA
ncbi:MULTISPECIES: helix-turn-helix domain-containing protein [unclassified Streptomyces]|uniref:helix-turn-helix domain-containing protein n=1 Tax=unclassified Streptomyces TaxID=2593676 RepID=UPI0011648A47|nr:MULTISPECIES: helix-turn-helix transcriptional regulator [unclassified Streptomyces]QDN63139.1 helix-turn-helix transcriptional regulator [Streptomyces sp. S1D4-20]QDO56941.1 helix-turn-helix transcriptional regulator [Streptomyces sp. RLB1-8]NMI54265.1 helix-turn-helix transcriptional regulator [Streptomyces sp. RLA2-12]QDN73191.1 helix-turn-helix transcriptional regulator [Streptomyces sp. S1D4-14]QDO55789.1 helix-turn-helix transcriptional regulator [Streptomyces sp. RLB3-5]